MLQYAIKYVKKKIIMLNFTKLEDHSKLNKTRVTEVV